MNLMKRAAALPFASLALVAGSISSIAAGPVSNGETDRNSERTRAGDELDEPSKRGGEYRALTDKEIEAAVRDELSTARRVSPDRIDVSVEDGVATLEGAVSDVLTEDRAVRIAQKVKGVRSVVNLLEVETAGRSPEEIREDVLEALAADPATSAWEIRIDVEDGVVVLRGTVDDWAEWRLAERVSKGVRGVRGVRNQIQVRRTEVPSDEEIERLVEERLRWDRRIDAELINVDAKPGGIVVLSGKAGSSYERSLAIHEAWVAGTTDVLAEHLEVDWSARKQMKRGLRWSELSDDDIRGAVQAALAHDPRVNEQDIEVDVEDGVVTLRGTFENLKAKRAAAQDAANTVGVREVNNRLRVDPSEQEDDARIERRLRAAVMRDPFLSEYEFRVKVVDGTAQLEGAVDSFFERAHAGDVAARTRGVREVRNLLEIDYQAPPDRPYHDWDPVEWDYDADYYFQYEAVRSDAEILEEIRDELFWSPFVDSDDVTVTVRNGVATLTGGVDSWAEFDAATENAIEGGAIKVSNELTVAMD